MDISSIERLTAHATPNRLPIDGDLEREQRNWVVRLAEDRPGEWNTDEVAMRLTSSAAEAVRQAHAQRGLAVESRPSPEVTVFEIDAKHLVVSVRTERLERDEAHAWLVAGASALRVLEGIVPLDDIQGFPRRFWRLLVES